jgi:hypothetical protein
MRPRKLDCLFALTYHHRDEASDEATMSSIAISSIVFVLVFGGALLGILLRAVLPEHHLSADSKDLVKLGMALVSTMAALVLGLLIASAKSSLDAQNAGLMDGSAKVVLLDRVLAHYGPETKETREVLRDSVVRALDQMRPRNGANPPKLGEPSTGSEVLLDKILDLSSKDESQRLLKAQALNIAWGLGQIRWLQYAQQANSVSMPLVITLVFWLTAIFVSFGLFAPRNPTVVACMFVSAASVSGAILMILEMYRPYAGLIPLSSAPLRAALTQLGK